MVDITQIMRFDDLASKDSPIHNLEGRIKLISTIFIILVCVVSKETFHTNNIGNSIADNP